MQKRISSAKLVALCVTVCLATFAVQTVQAVDVPISWSLGSVTNNTSGIPDVSTNGTLVEAVNFGAAVTLNTVPFESASAAAANGTGTGTMAWTMECCSSSMRV